mmetsp:Transcript_34736/g.110443  ORF Transcript_34736/g.110443 Transcript_34736/m.110443 type:complete len:418 (+) Transcript_34736:590-1843(+)
MGQQTRRHWRLLWRRNDQPHACRVVAGGGRRRQHPPGHTCNVLLGPGEEDGLLDLEFVAIREELELHHTAGLHGSSTQTAHGCLDSQVCCPHILLLPLQCPFKDLALMPAVREDKAGTLPLEIKSAAGKPPVADEPLQLQRRWRAQAPRHRGSRPLGTAPRQSLRGRRSGGAATHDALASQRSLHNSHVPSRRCGCTENVRKAEAQAFHIHPCHRRCLGLPLHAEEDDTIAFPCKVHCEVQFVRIKMQPPVVDVDHVTPNVVASPILATGDAFFHDVCVDMQTCRLWRSKLHPRPSASEVPHRYQVAPAKVSTVHVGSGLHVLGQVDCCHINLCSVLSKTRPPQVQQLAREVGEAPTCSGGYWNPSRAGASHQTQRHLLCLLGVSRGGMSPCEAAPILVWDATQIDENAVKGDVFQR